MAKSILIVDDAMFMRTMVRNILLVEGFAVHEAANGQEALEQYEIHNPQLVFMDITMPVMDAACARQWIGKRAKSRNSGLPVRMPFRQADFAKLPTIGSSLVNGASQTGSTLTIDGCTHGALIEAGRALSIIVGGRSYLYFVTDDVTVNGSGQAVVPIDGLLMRASPADNAAVAFDAPVIEGFIKGGDWATRGRRLVALADFSIDEAA